MSRRFDRRSFLRLGAAGLFVPAVSVGACESGGPPASSDAVGGDADEGGRATAGGRAPGEGDPGALIERPVLTAAADGTVHLGAPLGELPRAYVSRALRRVFVDYRYRDEARWVLGAHISVSTGLWRIRLRGDPQNQFVVPGDEQREFEELDISEWAPSRPAAEGDFRIVGGTPGPVTVRLHCVPVAGSDAWLSGGPWEITRCRAASEEPCREDFVEVGLATGSSVRGCERAGDWVRVLGWSHRS